MDMHPKKLLALNFAKLVIEIKNKSIGITTRASFMFSFRLFVFIMYSGLFYVPQYCNNEKSKIFCYCEFLERKIILIIRIKKTIFKRVFLFQTPLICEVFIQRACNRPLKSHGCNYLYVRNSEGEKSVE